MATHTHHHTTSHTTTTSTSTLDQISLDRRDLALILGAALPGLQEQLDHAEKRVRMLEWFEQQFPPFSHELQPRLDKLTEARQQRDELHYACAAALACQDALDQLPEQEQAIDVPALLRKHYGARPFGQTGGRA